MIISDGLGDAKATAYISQGVSIAGSVAAATWEIPYIGPIVAGVSLLIGALGIGGGCGQTCVASTKIVNAIEPYMKQNLQAARDQAGSNGGTLTSAEKKALLGNFDSLWAQVVSNCDQPQLADAGQRCINDRKAGGKWDWFSYYRTPIEQMPVKDPVVSVDSVMQSIESGGVGELALIGGGALALYLIVRAL